LLEITFQSKDFYLNEVPSKDTADCTTIVNFVGSPGETSVMKPVFQVTEVEHPEILPQHTVSKEPDNFRLNK
jgi:hypothetical protein